MSKSSNSATLKYKQELLTYYIDSFIDFEKLSDITESWRENDLSLIRAIWDIDVVEIENAVEFEYNL